MLTSPHPHPRGNPILLRALKLSNFRNYAALELRLGPGVTLIDGRNGQGKTNLLEAIYLMSIGRSSRGSADRQMVRAGALDDFLTHTQVVGDVATSAGRLGLQVDLSAGAPNPGASDQPPRVQKTFRVNGVPRRASDFVGLLKAALFAVEDVDLLSGPPAARRRYLDILTAQLTPGFAREAQDYQKVLTQRNHLLKSIRERAAGESELEFWDDQLCLHAARVVDARLRVIHALDGITDPIHRELSGLGQALSFRYSPSFELGDYADAPDLSRTMLDELRAIRRREIAAGFCLVGPHRDDFTAELDGMEVGSFASRGQTRTVILAMKLGEAQIISDSVGDKPLVLLDDVMSELDAERRSHVFSRISDYEQVIITTAQTDLADAIGNHPIRRVSIDSGRIIE